MVREGDEEIPRKVGLFSPMRSTAGVIWRCMGRSGVGFGLEVFAVRLGV